MGCTLSNDKHGRAGAAGDGGGDRPLDRSLSMPVRHSLEKQGHNLHLLSFASPTYGSMNEEEDYLPRKEEYPHGFYDNYRKNFDRSAKVAAKAWSDVNSLLSHCKPLRENQSKNANTNNDDVLEEEPETINTCELMEGLDDETMKHGQQSNREIPQNGSFSFDSQQPDRENSPAIAVADENGRKPLWMHFADDHSNTLFDSEAISAFRKSLEQLSPRNPTKDGGSFTESSRGEDEIQNETPVSTCSWNSRCRSGAFARPINKSSAGVSFLDEIPKKPDSENEGFRRLRAPPGGEDKVVLYFTSLRAIRKTYEDCCRVRLILQGFRVFVDERDVSLHAEYRSELRKLLGEQAIGLPVLFVRGDFIGGAEQVMQLHEEGELNKFFEGLPVQTCIRVCDGCGDMRFIPCLTCNGSCKLYTDEDELKNDAFAIHPDISEEEKLDRLSTMRILVSILEVFMVKAGAVFRSGLELGKMLCYTVCGYIECVISLLVFGQRILFSPPSAYFGEIFIFEDFILTSYRCSSVFTRNVFCICRTAKDISFIGVRELHGVY